MMLQCNAKTLETIRSILTEYTMTILNYKPYGGWVKVSVVSHDHETIYKITPDSSTEFNTLYQQAVEEVTRKTMKTHNSDWGYAPRRESINHFKCR